MNLSYLSDFPLLILHNHAFSDIKKALYLSLYCTSPKYSRFLKTFEKSNKYLNYKSIHISLDNILKGKDKRTTIMIKNLPKHIKKKEIRNLIYQYANINSLFILKNQIFNNVRVNHAFINIINYKRIIDIYNGLKNINDLYGGKDYEIEICYSQIQGKEELKNYFKKIN